MMKKEKNNKRKLREKKKIIKEMRLSQTEKNIPKFLKQKNKLLVQTMELTVHLSCLVYI